MATRDTLAPREADCSSGADYAALALEALQEPADKAYAKELMDRVADDCQFTKDLAAVAIAYKALGEQAPRRGIAADRGRLLHERARNRSTWPKAR